MNETPLVHLDRVVLRFADKAVLEGINLKIFPRDRLVVLGQSGGGKITMLRLILGILGAASGDVAFNDLRIQPLNRDRLQLLRSRDGVGYKSAALLSSCQ